MYSRNTKETHGFNVGADGSASGIVDFHKQTKGRSTRERLKAKSTRTSKQIYHASAFKLWCPTGMAEYVEHRLAGAVRCWPRVLALGGLDGAALVFSGYNAHADALALLVWRRERKMSDPMKRALELAHAAAAKGEVPVGAVVMDPVTAEIIGEGANGPIGAHDPTAHAEVVALRAAGKYMSNYRLTGLHLYVTLEPCTMCAGAISFARIAKLVFAAPDEKGGAVVHGTRFFEQPTCHWRPDVVQDEASAQEAAMVLRDFFKARR